MKLWARFRRFWHCLFTFHRSLDVVLVFDDDTTETYIRCADCNKVWE